MSDDSITGIYMRVKRDDKWQSLDIATLNEDELTQAFESADKERVIKFFAATTEWIRVCLVGDPNSD
jgi:hypothetical protein